MPTDFQVVMDCAAPHELADWWAEALGWQVEPQDEAFIRRMIDAGYASEADTTTHHGALVWKEGAAINSPDPGRPRVLFQLVPGPPAPGAGGRPPVRAVGRGPPPGEEVGSRPRPDGAPDPGEIVWAWVP